MVFLNLLSKMAVSISKFSPKSKQKIRNPHGNCSYWSISNYIRWCWKRSSFQWHVVLQCLYKHVVENSNENWNSICHPTPIERIFSHHGKNRSCTLWRSNLAVNWHWNCWWGLNKKGRIHGDWMRDKTFELRIEARRYWRTFIWRSISLNLGWVFQTIP